MQQSKEKEQEKKGPENRLDLAGKIGPGKIVVQIITNLVQGRVSGANKSIIYTIIQ